MLFDLLFKLYTVSISGFLFSEFIDDAFTEDALNKVESAGRSAEMEKVSSIIYGRTAEDSEMVKKKNRENAVDFLQELNNKPYINIEDLEHLHRINNRSIVAPSVSKIRQDGQGVTFGRREGTIGRDVQFELQSVLVEVEKLFDQQALGMSNMEYSIKAAKIHNDFLEIHPFFDRNGSTAMLLLELLMMRNGYEPPQKREKDYYKKLRKILGNNPVSVGVVALTQAKIGYSYGYYEGRAAKVDPARRAVYETRLQKRKDKVKK